MAAKLISVDEMTHPPEGEATQRDVCGLTAFRLALSKHKVPFLAYSEAFSNMATFYHYPTNKSIFYFMLS